MAYRAYKYRIYPSEEQKIQISKTIGCCRLMYNQLLEDCNKQLVQNGKIKIKKYTDIKKNFEFMNEVSSSALHYVPMYLDLAWKRYFKKLGGKPTFHNRYRTNSFTIQNSSNNVRFENGKIRIPTIGLVKGVFHRFCKGDIKTVTVSNKNGIYEISLMVEVADTLKPEMNFDTEKILGIDMAFHGGAVYSDGTTMDMPDYITKVERRIKHLQRCLDRKIGQKKGEEKSKNWKKNKHRIDKLIAKVARQKRYFLDVESSRIAKNYDVVIVEDIDLKNMSNKKRHCGKSVSKINFGMFRTMLQYKMEEKNGLFMKADRFFPSSQICSACGFQNQELKNLKIRHWECPQCGSEHDRDINAAINLQHLYVPRLYRELMPVEGCTNSMVTLNNPDEAGKTGESEAPGSNLQTYSLTLDLWQKKAFDNLLNAKFSVKHLQTVRKGKTKGL